MRNSGKAINRHLRTLTVRAVIKAGLGLDTPISNLKLNFSSLFLVFKGLFSLLVVKL